MYINPGSEIIFSGSVLLPLLVFFFLLFKTHNSQLTRKEKKIASSAEIASKQASNFKGREETKLKSANTLFLSLLGKKRERKKALITTPKKSLYLFVVGAVV